MPGLVLHITGARPNFPKAAPVIRALTDMGVAQELVHTGQHYDERMSEVFFRQLGLPEPDVNLGAGSDTHARQTAAIMIGLEGLIQRRNPAMVVVYGDVNSTAAAALVAAKAAGSARPRRSRAAQLRHEHAGRDQPAGHRSAIRPALRHHPRTPWPILVTRASTAHGSTSSATR